MTESATEDRTDEILGLCDAWAAAAAGVSGLQLRSATEKNRLRNHGLYPHTLSYRELRASLIGLTRILLLPGLNTVIDWDHQHAWAWCGELLAGQGSDYFGSDEREIKSLLGIACRASLAGISSPDGDGFEKARAAREALEPNARELVLGAHDVLVYLSFPLLEAIAKKACRKYVDYGGNVVAGFTTPARRYETGQRISSLRDLLWLLHDTVATTDLSKALDGQRSHLAGLDSSRDPFQTIYDWRNESLHGQTTYTTIGGTVFNTALLIALDGISDTYDAQKQRVLASMQREAQSRQFGSTASTPWTYYPPYW